MSTTLVYKLTCEDGLAQWVENPNPNRSVMSSSPTKAIVVSLGRDSNHQFNKTKKLPGTMWLLFIVSQAERKNQQHNTSG